MTVSRRGFLRSSAFGAVSLTPASVALIERVAQGQVRPAAVGLDLDTVEQDSAKPFRMTRPWYERQIQRLQGSLRERKLRGLIIRDSGNLNYLTGIFLTNTERPAWLWVPANGELAIFGPGLDRHMYSEWWIADAQWYFDFPHTGSFNTIGTEKGPPVDLTTWMLKEVAKRGGGEGRIGVERELTPSALKRMKTALPKVTPVVAGDIVDDMQRRKTPEELTLIQVAIDYNDRMLQFARDLIADRGLGMYDSAVRRAVEEYAEGLIFSELKLTGKAHSGVGLILGCDVIRAGAATAYPHPNQYFHKRIARGDAIQISSIFALGGYGGEGYRALHLEPIPALGRKMWEVHTEMTLAQAEHSRPGIECRDVAEKVLAIAKRENMLEYVYHRPAHGQGMEGHQPPYIALGDTTVLREGMTFSNEPGLYNPRDGYGYNHSNTVLITADGARRMNRTPLTKDFCWITN